MLNWNECNLKLFISIEILNLCYDLSRGDSHVSNAKNVGELCWAQHECQMHSRCVKADPSHGYGRCQCLPGYVRTNTWIECIEPKQYKESCEYTEQCTSYDPNTLCDTELGQSRLKCLCNDFFKYNIISGKCEWCEAKECRRPYIRYGYDDSYGQRYNRWYHNVNGIFGMWASLLIVALPISLFLFFLGVRFTKQLMKFYTRDLSVNFDGNETNNLVESTQSGHEFFVRLPPDPVLTEAPPAYEDLSKAIRLPTYEEAVNMSSIS